MINRIPGRLKSRINIRKGRATESGSGLNYAWHRHGGTGPSGKSQFTISQGELIEILRRKGVIGTPVSALLSGNFAREVDVGQTIGSIPREGSLIQTSVITIITDREGNLANTFPGGLNREVTLS